MYETNQTSGTFSVGQLLQGHQQLLLLSTSTFGTKIQFAKLHKQNKFYYTFETPSEAALIKPIPQLAAFSGTAFIKITPNALSMRSFLRFEATLSFLDAAENPIQTMPVQLTDQSHLHTTFAIENMSTKKLVVEMSCSQVQMLKTQKAYFEFDHGMLELFNKFVVKTSQEEDPVLLKIELDVPTSIHMHNGFAYSCYSITPCETTRAMVLSEECRIRSLTQDKICMESKTAAIKVRKNPTNLVVHYNKKTEGKLEEYLHQFEMQLKSTPKQIEIPTLLRRITLRGASTIMKAPLNADISVMDPAKLRSEQCFAEELHCRVRIIKRWSGLSVNYVLVRAAKQIELLLALTIWLPPQPLNFFSKRLHPQPLHYVKQRPNRYYSFEQPTFYTRTLHKLLRWPCAWLNPKDQFGKAVSLSHYPLESIGTDWYTMEYHAISNTIKVYIQVSGTTQQWHFKYSLSMERVLYIRIVEANGAIVKQVFGITYGIKPSLQKQLLQSRFVDLLIAM